MKGLKLSDIKKEWSKYIIIKDEHILDVIFANLVNNFVIRDDRVWTMIVAQSSGGKTTLLNPCRFIPSTHFVDDLTEKTFLSGFKPGKGKPETSFLKTIGDGMIIISDATAILSKNPQSKGEILGQLRCIHDGTLIKRTGTGEISWKGKIGLLGASTPEIYYQLESSKAMGERFLYYWMEQPTDAEIHAKQAENRISADDLAGLMGPFYKDFCQEISEYVQLKGMPPLRLTEEQRAEIYEALVFCINGKATVHTDFKSGKVDQLPNKSGVGRDNKMFEATLHALQLIHCYETGDWDAGVQSWMLDIVRKIAYSSINRERRALLEILAEKEVPIKVSKMVTVLGIEKAGIETSLAPLHAVGLVQKRVNGTDHRWFIESSKLKKFILDVSESMRFTPQDRKDVVVNPEPEDDAAMMGAETPVETEEERNDILNDLEQQGML